MCGIAGYFKKKLEKNALISCLHKMNQSQIHRGPNSTNSYINPDNNLGLIMCRLSILDLELGMQPMTSKDGRYTIIFNGTILNSPELRKELEQKNVKFFTNNSDTEVLLQLLINYGIEKLDKLNGSFAFAFYDNHKKKIICARDRFGLAPFYYTWKNNEFLFASELKALLATGKISNELNFESLNKYLSLLWVPGPDTILNDVKKLPAGYFIKIDIDKEKFSINKWWDIEIKQTNYKNLNEITEEIKQTLEQSVKRATLSDVPLACGLSGGLDSQSIVGLLAKNNYKVNTFTMGFDGHEPGDLNEIEVSKIASKKFNTNHTEMIIETNDYFNDLDKMIYHLDEPYGGGLPLWHVLKEAGKNFGVILTGLGGDELFGNFGRWTLLEKTHYKTLKNKFHFDTLFFNRKYFFSENLKSKLINKELKSSASTYLKEIIDKNDLTNMRDKIMYLDVKTQLQDEYCNMVNKFSMANQIEARAPFLDNDFTNLIFSISSNIRTSKKDFKYLLRESMKEIIPKQNLNNRKRGFIGPESRKQNFNYKELNNTLFSPNKIKSQNIFDADFIKNFLKSFEEKGCYKENLGFFTKNYGYKSLWGLVMFQKWYDIFLDKNNNNFQLKL
jgi:asparagine synthase (glutamine-hydrolysing)